MSVNVKSTLQLPVQQHFNQHAADLKQQSHLHWSRGLVPSQTERSSKAVVRWNQSTLLITVWNINDNPQAHWGLFLWWNISINIRLFRDHCNREQSTESFLNSNETNCVCALVLWRIRVNSCGFQPHPVMKFTDNCAAHMWVLHIWPVIKSQELCCTTKHASFSGPYNFLMCV